ncbi:2-hydroxycarboxylate transporter family protein [Lentibacillus sp. CBA3610]|uniref:2-hydroxycarboxylate transporter family protein n=1 Tax=Lentibacillus sp. CBA3610 TaxID=2518176 RepID=UPI001595EF66|nr:2-hydroxycarboxylate transporter family protein [Lentibacillus sp. CBA3610]QKY70164.1 2-hydroxycarboxylate transporter family protein [Lentibacillus sp. CBA3610]
MDQRLEQEETEQKSIWQRISIFNIPVIWFGVITILTLIAMYTDNLPAGIIGSLLIMMVLGELFGWIGDHTPIIRSYLGGGAILAIFGSALMVYTGLMPEQTITMIDEFMTSGGFLNFYIAALITGSILGMNTATLKKAGARFALPLLASVLAAMGLAGFIGLIIGYGFRDAILLIAMPIMGGGMGAGAVPMSQVYSELLGNDPSYYISVLVPALALGNVFAIILAGILNMVGKKLPSLTGNGQLMAGFHVESKKITYDINQMGIGVIAALLFYVIGQMLGVFIPIHPYALMIITVAVFKIAGWLPEIVENGANQWYQFVAKNWTLALLIGIGVAYTDMEAVINALTVEYVLLVASVIVGAVLGAGLLGKVVGFHPIESAITAGLCMANMGGTGDVAVLSASRRMELMPFAQISSRLGGALILLIASLIVPLL